MKKAIYINSYSRPKHLYVCLDSLKKSDGIGEWDVFVDFDGGSNADFGVCRGLLPFAETRQKRNLGPRDHATAILRSFVESGYDWILYGEEDSLYRKDALNHAWSRRELDGWISLFHPPEGIETGFVYMSYAPVFFSRREADELLHFLERREFIGMPNVTVPGEAIKPDEPGHDICWCAFTVARKKTQWFSGKPMSLNFGFDGYNHKNGGTFESEAFGGAPETWLEKAVSIATARSDPRLGTVGFKYED